LAQTSHVTLTVYDLLGREVSVLVDEVMGAGRHESKFDARALSTGVYICRLRAGSSTALKTMVMLK